VGRFKKKGNAGEEEEIIPRNPLKKKVSEGSGVEDLEHKGLRGREKTEIAQKRIESFCGKREGRTDASKAAPQEGGGETPRRQECLRLQEAWASGIHNRRKGKQIWGALKV